MTKRFELLRAIFAAALTAGVCGSPTPALAQSLTSGSEFVVNAITTDDQERPGVVPTGDGGYLVIWTGDTPGPGFGVASYGRIFDESGQPLAPDFEISSTPSDLQPTVVAATPDDEFFVVLEETDGDGDGIVAHRHASDGTALGSPFVVNGYTSGDQTDPRVSSAADGSFVVVWQSTHPGDLEPRTAGRRFDSTGAPAGTEFEVPAAQADGPAIVDVSASGRFAVVWEEILDTYVQRYDSSGAPVGTEIALGSGNGLRLGVADDGGFAVSYTKSPVLFETDLLFQRYDSTGIALGTEIQANSDPTATVQYPTIAVSPDGSALVTWGSSSS